MENAMANKLEMLTFMSMPQIMYLTIDVFFPVDLARSVRQERFWFEQGPDG
jgi:hypothetical protein